MAHITSEALQVLSTSDYDLFSLLPGNRPEEEAHIKQLMVSMKEESFLYCRPITVDPRLRIIDGQHRFKAAKRLGLPIYYMIARSENDTRSTLIAAKLNANARNWRSKDFINAFAAEGKPEYIRFRDFLKSNTRLTQELLISLIIGKCSYNVHLCALKAGTFDYHWDGQEITKKMEKVFEIVDLIEPHVKGKASFLMGRSFWVALFRFMENPRVDWGKFVEKVSYQTDQITHTTGIEAYLQAFKKVYNHKVREANRV